MLQRNVNGVPAENSETRFNTTEAVFDVSALSILVGHYPLQMLDSASLTPRGLAGIEAGQASPLVDSWYL